MAEKKWLKTEVGERVEQSDFEFGTNTAHREALQNVISSLVTGDATTDNQPKNFIIHGFDSDTYGLLGGTTVTINGGKAVVGLRPNGAAEFGFVLSGGASTRSLDLGAFPDGTFGIYIRAELQADRYLGRIKWEPLSDPAAETASTMATRVVEDWSITASFLSPGPEWIQVASAVKDSGDIDLTDTRQLMFEGTATEAFLAVDEEWGSDDDRDPDRSTFGVRSVRRAIRGLQRQVADIIGDPSGDPVGWWTEVAIPLASLLARDGSRTLLGAFTRFNPFSPGYVPVFVSNQAPNSDRQHVRVFVTTDVQDTYGEGLVVTYNADWVDGEWSADEPELDPGDQWPSYMFAVCEAGVLAFKREPGAGTWEDVYPEWQTLMNWGIAVNQFSAQASSTVSGRFTGGYEYGFGQPRLVTTFVDACAGLGGAAGADFSPGANSTTWLLSTDTGSVSIPIKLPHGSTITDVEFSLQNTLTDVTEISIWRDAWSSGGTTWECLRFAGPLTLGYVATRDWANLPVDTGLVVDNLTYRYMLVVSNIVNGENTVLFGARVTTSHTHLTLQ